MNTRIVLACACAIATVGSGCRNPEGRLRPPDPIGYAIVEFFDRGPHQPPQNPQADQEFVGVGPSSATPARGLPPSPTSIWVDGTWGMSNGRRVWIPAHWQ